MAKHTAGDWCVESSYTGFGSDLIVMADDQCTVIADCRHDLGVKDADEADANARLLAAAPKLLESLKVLLTLSNLILKHRPNAASSLAEARYTIAIATGSVPVIAKTV